MSELTTEEIETCIKTMFAEDGPAALDEAYAIYRRGGITSTRWVRAMNEGLRTHGRRPMNRHDVIAAVAVVGFAGLFFIG